MKLRLLSGHRSIQGLVARRFLPAIAILLLAGLAVLPWRASASPTNFVAGDTNALSLATMPNSQAACSLWNSAALALGPVHVIDFETPNATGSPYPTGFQTSLLLAPGVTLSSIAPNKFTISSATLSQGIQVFNTTPGGQSYAGLGALFNSPVSVYTFQFNNPIQAFGLYITGRGQLSPLAGVLSYTDSNTGISNQIQLPNPAANFQLSAQFGGFTDTNAAIYSVTITLGPSSLGNPADSFAFDDVRFTYFCPPEPFLLFNTGMDTNGVVLPSDATDPHYSLTTNPNGASSTAFVVTPLPVGWRTNTPTSQWIGPTTNGVGVGGTYDYQLTFNVPCSNNAVVTGQWAVDNNGTILLNGNPAPVATLTGGGSGNFTTWHPFAITTGLVAGQNSLEFYVTNVGANPTGLRVELSGTATCCTNPCITLICFSNKTVSCGENWNFDAPTNIADACCTNFSLTFSDVTNGVAYINFTGGGSAANGAVNFVGSTAISGYLNITAGSNMGTYTLLPGSGSNTLFVWDGLIFPTSNPFLDLGGLLFTNSGVEINLFGNGPGSYTLAGAPPTYAPLVTNGVATLAVCPQMITRTWLFTDACGNSNFCSQTVTVVNTNSPVITNPPNLTVTCGTAWNFTTPTAFDSCSGSSVMVIAQTPLTNGLCPTVITETWIASNLCNGLTATATQTVTLVSCVPPPAGMTLWLPFDETSGITSANLYAGGNNGTQINGPGVNLGSYVANSLCFNGVNQSVSVPDYPAINPGTGNFSIDAWVKRDPASGNNVRIIADKRDPTSIIGYSLSVSYGNLIFQLCDSPNNFDNYRDTGAVLADNQWHFVAVTVNRFATNGGRFYIDGVATGTFDPTGHPGSLNNPNAFLVATTPVFGASPWLGCIDEVEFFLRALAPGEVQGIFNAGPAGKCKLPEVVCANNKVVQCGTNWSFDQPVVNTPCNGTNYTLVVLGTVTNGACPTVVTRTWLVVDGCGYTNTCSQTVSIVDTTSPTITCKTNLLVVALNTNCQLVIPAVSASATDNCTPTSQLVFMQSPTNGTIVSGLSQLVTVTVIDLCGNSNSCSVKVMGLDKTGPVLTGPTSVTVSNCLVPCLTNLVTAVDNCCPQSSLKKTQSPPCDTPLGPGINSVTVTVTDCKGNSSTKVIHLNGVGSTSFLTNLFNTGVSNNGSLLALGAVDPHYTLGPVPIGTPGYVAPNAVAITNVWGWLELVHVSEWIAPTLASIGNCPAGYYTYTNQFVLPSGANPGTASISGRWAADDGATMYFNGVLQGANTISLLPVASGFNHWHPLAITSGFLANPNTNTILFVVTNSANYSPGPTGLRVEYTNALVNCYTCSPPAIVSITSGFSVPNNGLAALSVAASGTPPLSYQWHDNGVALLNASPYSGVKTANLLINPIHYANAGLYTVVISNACGTVTGKVHMAVSPGWAWSWGWWNVAQLASPLAATFGPDLILSGPNGYALSAGSTEDFGLPNPGGQIVNVMDVPPLPVGTAIQVPLIAPAGSNSVNSYSVIMDLYEPGTSSGTTSVVFIAVSYCYCIIGGSGQDGVEMTLDASNLLHLTGYAGGVAFDLASPTPLAVDAWNRVAMVIDDPHDGVGVNLSLYNNGQLLGTLNVATTTGLPINWSNSVPTILSRHTNDVSLNGEFYVSSVQFHAVALTPDEIAGIGSPDTGPAPANDPSVGPQPVLSATKSNGSVSFIWAGSPYVLQETTDLTSGNWTDSALSFTERTDGTLTTVLFNPATEGPSKFYRLIYAP
jgi:hypothetical protein